MNVRVILGWILFGVLLLLGVFMWFGLYGYGFLAITCISAALVVLCYQLLSILARRGWHPAKGLRLVFTSLLSFGLILCAGTEACILAGADGSPDSCEYMVVLGAGVNGRTPSRVLQDRLDAAWEYLTDHPNCMAVLSGGKGPGEDITEAQCMFEQLTDRGIAPERLLLEDRATSTMENLRYSLKLLEERTGEAPEKLGILSSEFHLFRAGLMAQTLEVEPVGIPAETTLKVLRLNYYFREIPAVWKYLILGS